MAIIVIEGLDGAGKSTQIELLNGYFTRNGVATQFMHFPRVGVPFFGELVAKFLRGDLGQIEQVDPYVVALLYATDRFDAAEIIAECTNRGKVLLLDRYVYSNIAFQCAKLASAQEQEALRKWIFELEFERFAIPKPSINIFLDVPFEFTRAKLTQTRTGDDREYLKGKTDIHEANLTFQQVVRQIYLQQQQYDNHFKVIECGNEHGEMLPPDEIHRRIVELVEDRCLVAKLN